MKYQKELIPSESFEEFCDVVGKLVVCLSSGTVMNDLILLLLFRSPWSY